MGFLDLPESRLLIAAPAATPSKAVPPAINGVFAFPAAWAIVAPALLVCSTAVSLIASTLLLFCELAVERDRPVRDVFLLRLFVLELRVDRFDAEPLSADADVARDPLRLVERLLLVCVVAIPLLTCAYRSSVLAAARCQSLEHASIGERERRSATPSRTTRISFASSPTCSPKRADFLGGIRQVLGRCPRGPSAKTTGKNLLAGGSP
jgi:hypothetical protein